MADQEIEKNKENRTEDESIENLRRERDEYREKYLRKLAEMDNYRKMLEREKKIEIEKCKAEIVREFIEPYENLQRALQDDNVDKKGIELVLKQMEKILKSLGVEEIASIGERFDPMIHEAIAVVDGEEDGIVKVVYQKGYMLNGTVLRHAKVMVSKKMEVNENGRKDNRD